MVEKSTNSQKRENKPHRNEKGHLLPGHPGLPGAGRPKGSVKVQRVGFMEAAQAWAEEKGITVKGAAANVLGVVYETAMTGDMQAAKLFLDRVMGSVSPAPQVSIDNRQVHIGGQDGPAATGPPAPDGVDFRQWMAGLLDMHRELSDSNGKGGGDEAPTVVIRDQPEAEA